VTAALGPGRTVLVTGASGGLGPAVVEAFLAGGWRVVAASRSGRAERRDGLLTVAADLGDEAGVAAAVEAAAADPAAPLRALANLVGGYVAGTRLHETPVATLEAQLALNLRPTWLATRAVLPHLVAAGGGAIVCLSARAALAPFSGAAAYATSKAAVLALVQAVAVEYRRDGVRCNAVVPSVIDTPANRAAQPDADHSRWVPPEQVAAVVRFLCGDESLPTSGATVPVYGRA
jgi:NAD(P)-dependent dehydrogenase (short-subunit alcohol dehydrogenase family)